MLTATFFKNEKVFWSLLYEHLYMKSNKKNGNFGFLSKQLTDFFIFRN